MSGKHPALTAVKSWITCFTQKVMMSKDCTEIFTSPLCNHPLKMWKIWKPFLLAGCLPHSLHFREMMSYFIMCWWYFRSKATEPLSWQKAFSTEAELSFLYYLAGTWGIYSSEHWYVFDVLLNVARQENDFIPNLKLNSAENHLSSVPTSILHQIAKCVASLAPFNLGLWSWTPLL